MNEKVRRDVYHSKRFPWMAVILVIGAVNCAAQQPTPPSQASPPAASGGADASQSNDLQKQLEQLKKQYDTWVAGLRTRSQIEYK